MPLDSEKKRLEARLLDLLSRALLERNRDDIVGTSLKLGALYLSGDLYDKSEECFHRVLGEPVADLARADEKAQAEAGLARVALCRGHLTLAQEALERAEALLSGQSEVLIEVRQLQCQRDLHAGRYREVVDTIESTLTRESPDKLGDTRVDFMILEGRARRLMGRNRQAVRLLEKALELAENTGYEAGTARARSELGALLGTLGQFKSAQEVLSAALRSNEAMGRQYRLDRDHCRLGLLLVHMGRWEEAENLLLESYRSSRDLRTLENRLGSQLARAQLLCLRGDLEDARDLALDAMEVARSAGFVRRHAEGLLGLGNVAVEGGQPYEALDFLREAEALYSHLAPESNIMLQVHAAIGRAHDALGESSEAFDALMRAHNLGRETGNAYERHRVDSLLGAHFQHEGDSDKAADVLTKAASELGTLGAKYDVAQARLWFAELLCEMHSTGPVEQRQRDAKLARSNLFEARRLLEGMGARRRLAEVTELESRLQPELPSPSSEA
ncbi:MAG: tetratricopeptide repeat protein [Candidatus Krumholzibacteriia bacterium]